MYITAGIIVKLFHFKILVIRIIISNENINISFLIFCLNKILLNTNTRYKKRIAIAILFCLVKANK
ncbi:hypothetical protein C0W44_12065 [Photobacterium leiognathi subsp. mandapamensis]|nr:hypothetical protein C0W44_12065 [Photobacterium leiognathi subsp. mandapamensis]